LTHKLVAAFLITFLIIIIFIMLTTKFLVSGSFQTYLQELQWQGAESVMEEVVQVVETNDNDISIFVRNPHVWEELLWKIYGEEGVSMPTGPPTGPPSGAPSGAPPGAESDWPRSPSSDLQTQGPSPAAPVKSLADMEIALLRDSLALYDIAGNRLGGSVIEAQDQVRKEIRVNDQLVGYLVLRSLVDIEDRRTLIFHQQFNRILFLTGGLGLIAAFLASIFVAKQFLAPVECLTQGTRALAEKKLDTRIPVSSDDELGQLAKNFNWMADQIEQMTQELTELSLRDPLTSLRNRRYFEQFVAPQGRSLINERLYTIKIGDERRSKDLKGMGLLLLDIDHFKQVNDGFGHDVGDRILVQFSDLVGKLTRGTDTTIRFGGEEFLIALRNTRFDYLPICAEKIRAKVAAYPFEIDDQGNTIKLTCSIGFTRFPFCEKCPDFFDIGEAQILADLSLYYAKDEGRNMCVGLSPVGDAICECDKSLLLTDIDYGIRQGVWRLERTPFV
jgi:diguanylate cyclase (GGDEF)-like protein